MKRLVCAILFVALFFGLVGCGKPSLEEVLTSGKWVGVGAQADTSQRVDFYPDGTGVVTRKRENSTRVLDRFHWDFDGTTLHLDYDDSNHTFDWTITSYTESLVAFSEELGEGYTDYSMIVLEIKDP